MTDRPPLLELRDIEACYSGAIVALHGVSLVVRPGEIVALLGTNGAGKTTTLKAASNLLAAERGQVTTGSIRFDGKDVRRLSPGELVRGELVPVPEGRHVFRSLSIEENLITGAIARGSGRAALATDLQRVYSYFPRLQETRRIAAGLASGGEQQMTALGRALMSRPRLLVLDEPSMGLAPRIVQSMFQTLAMLNRKEGLSILVAEQNSTIALRIAHRATVLENGVAVLEGDTKSLRERADIKTFYLGQAVQRAA